MVSRNSGGKGPLEPSLSVCADRAHCDEFCRKCTKRTAATPERSLSGHQSTTQQILPSDIEQTSPTLSAYCIVNCKSSEFCPRNIPTDIASTTYWFSGDAQEVDAERLSCGEYVRRLGENAEMTLLYAVNAAFASPYKRGPYEAPDLSSSSFVLKDEVVLEDIYLEFAERRTSMKVTATRPRKDLASWSSTGFSFSLPLPTTSQSPRTMALLVL
jgi:hypothetical protein